MPRQDSSSPLSTRSLKPWKANPNLQIDVLQRPVDIESGKSLKGSDVSLDDDKPHAFSLQITRKIKP